MNKTTNMLQLRNARNQWQGKAKRVLCVCSAGLLRSPTLAGVLHTEFGYNTRAAGAESSYALISVSHALIEWADEICCMDLAQQYFLESSLDCLGYKEGSKKIYTLDVPDNYGYGDPVLKEMLLKAYKLASKE